MTPDFWRGIGECRRVPPSAADCCPPTPSLPSKNLLTTWTFVKRGRTP